MSGFETTRWSLVLKAGDDSPAARRALDSLCQRYRSPVLAYLRRRGIDGGDAEDLTQAFFEKIIAQRLYERADPQRGRFRTFLLSALENFVNDEHQWATRLKRGGGTKAQSLTETELAADVVATDPDTPESDFDRQWALAVLDGAIDRLAMQCEAHGKGEIFRKLKSYVIEPAEHDSYQQLAGELGSRPNTIAAAVLRLRTSLRRHIRAELADTVHSNADVDAELVALREALAFAGASRA